jgi:hypothetical protein
VSQRDRLISRLFRIPGDGERQSDTILARAAEAHRTLLKCAASEASLERSARPLLPAIAALLEHLPSRTLVPPFLVDPEFIEGLHRATGISRTLAAWHRCVAEPSIANVGAPPGERSAKRLGNSLLPLLLRDDPCWCGQIELRTDYYGRLRFPLCDWSIALWSTKGGPNCVFSDEEVTASITRREVRFSLGGQKGHTVVVLPRPECLRMIVADDANLDGSRIRYNSSEVSARLQCTAAIPGFRTRYEPVSLTSNDVHAAQTGGIVASILSAMSRNSPAIAREFSGMMSFVRGWELPTASYGTVQSFSDPTLPRVMGMNVTYAADDEPRLCPFCFTWFGHELGHTKTYLIETILHLRGESLTTNQADYTDVIERYGRALSLRTLLQIPYTHLYEWTVLMDFIDGEFSALPWEIHEDPIAFGEDIREEIVEAFDRIECLSKLTECGRVAVARLHSLCSEAQVRWQSLQSKASVIAGSGLPRSLRNGGSVRPA